jgi:quinol monooxygenase YgiN
MSSTPSPLIAAPEIYNLAPVTDFKRANEPKPDTLLILAYFEYKSGKSTNALEGWKAFVDYCNEKEPETLGYTLMEDPEKNTIRTVEVYENDRFVVNVHLKSPAVKANQDQNGADRTGRKGAAHLRIVQGFLGKQ